MPATYDAIATTQLTSNSSTITFSSISQSFTDLRVVLNTAGTGGAVCNVTFNGATSGYSWTQMISAGGLISASRVLSASNIRIDGGSFDPNRSVTILDINNYSGTSFYKNAIWSLANNANSSGSGTVTQGIGRWNSTAGISTITFTTTDTFVTGTNATIYGILRA